MNKINRPDCAYFLVIGLTIAGFLITIGGVFTYVAYWPEAVLQEALTPNHHQRHRYGTLGQQDIGTPKLVTQDEKFSPLGIIGPLFLVAGGILLSALIGLGLKYRCDHEPEPNIAFLRLQSQWSLNLDSDRNKYELMVANSSSGLRNPPQAPTV